ncbi:MAG: hypothetical protein K0R41_3934 [Geminicoccaceae bacterium]|jgi:hypothetical protein|nr:hypothetical protein [Geminicoccaceae bacterium]
MTPNGKEHNRRWAEIKAERDRREEEELIAEDLFGRPTTAEDRAKKDAIARKWDEWAAQQMYPPKWF